MIDTKLLRQKILDLAIRGKLVPQDKNDEPASVLLERIRKEKAEFIIQNKIKKGKQESFIYKNPANNRHYENVGGKVTDIEDQIPFTIPDSWQWVRIKEIFIVNPRNYIADDLEVAFIPMPLICEGFSNMHSQETRIWKNIKTGFTHFAEGDIGVAKITPCFENLKSVIFTSLLNGYGAGTTELHIFRNIFSLPTLSEYALSFFKSLHFTANATFAGQVGQQRVPRAYFEDALFPIPPQNELERIVQQIKVTFQIVDNLDREQNELTNLAALAKSKILDLAMHGKLVPQDPNDEPASELLKRISTSHKPHYEDIPKYWTECQLGDALDYEQPQKYIVESTDYNDTFKTPVLTAGKSFILGYTNETQGVFTDLPCIIFDDFTTESKFVNFSYKVKSSAMKILTTKEFVDTRFVYFLMQTIKVNTGTHKRYWISDFSKKLILIPPIKEQKRIVVAIEKAYRLIDAMD